MSAYFRPIAMDLWGAKSDKYHPNIELTWFCENLVLMDNISDRNMLLNYTLTRSGQEDGGSQSIIYNFGGPWHEIVWEPLT